MDLGFSLFYLSWSSFSVRSFRIVFIFDRAQRISLFGRSEMVEEMLGLAAP